MILKRVKLGVVLCAIAIGVAGCSARKTYPEAQAGWHTLDFSVIFGRLQRVAGPTAASPPIWTIRFGTTQDPYLGELALTPPERLVGYSGGETVEVHGQVLAQQTQDAFIGRWYVVNSIQMWSGYR